jgi:hypothetical protein
MNPIRISLEDAEAHPGLIDRILEVQRTGKLPRPTPCKTLWGKYQTAAIRKDGKVMKPFRG